jgi:hypothetical protein
MLEAIERFNNSMSMAMSTATTAVAIFSKVLDELSLSVNIVEPDDEIDQCAACSEQLKMR